jgi:hypothetical protein
VVGSCPWCLFLCKWSTSIPVGRVPPGKAALCPVKIEIDGLKQVCRWQVAGWLPAACHLPFFVSLTFVAEIGGQPGFGRFQ